MIFDSGDTGDSGGVDTGDITKSLRFRASGSTYMSRTFGTPTDNKKWTMSMWAKRGALGTNQHLFSSYTDGSNYFDCRFNSSNQLYIQNRVAAANLLVANTTAVFRDPSSFIHVVFVFDSANATAAYRNRLYVNGAELTWSANSGSGDACSFNKASAANTDIGASHTAGLWAYLDGYLSRVCFVDGQALTPSSFGYLNTEINEWVSKSASAVKAVVDAGGTNSFMLDFDNGSSLTTLGYDKSSKGNNWTLNNHSLGPGVNTDWMEDRPGNSFCVLSPISPNPTLTGSTLTNGNLTASASAANTMRKGTVALPTTGKWYGMAKVPGTTVLFGLGEKNVNSWGTNSSTTDARTFYLYNTASLYTLLPGADTSVASALTSGGTLAFAYDADSLKLWLGYATSGAGSITWVGGGDPAAGTSATYTLGASAELYPLAGTNGSAIDVFFGAHPTPYTPPTGFKALCQANLTTPAILDPTDHHIDIAVTKSGNTNFTLPWDASVYDTFFEIKRRDAAGDWYQIDGLRGYDKILKSNSTAAETTDANVLGVSGTTCTLKSTLADGTYVISASKAGLTASRQTNTDGSITSTVSRNVLSGFAIVIYTAPGSGTFTVGHGLGSAPKMKALKSRTGAFIWSVAHIGAGAMTSRLQLESTAAATASVFTAPTSSVLNLPTSYADSTNYVAYCYTDTAIQKSFSWQNNNSADGTFINLGFEVGRVRLKNSDNVENWHDIDSVRLPYNRAAPAGGVWVEPNLSDAENSFYVTTATIDIVSQGLKIRTTNPAAGEVSFGTRNYIGHAWATTNGKFSNAR